MVLPTSLRMLLRHKRFTTLAILSLGLGIALNTTMFSVLDAVMNPKLDLPDPDRLYEIRYFGDYRQLVPVHERIAAYEQLRTVTGMTWRRWSSPDRMVERGDRVREVNTYSISPNYFAVVGSRAFAGRLFVESDLDASPRPVVFSERLWNHFFPELTEFQPSTVIIGDQPRLIVGLLRDNADLPGWNGDVWQLPTRDELPTMFPYIGRLQPGVTVTEARAELATLAQRFNRATGARDSRHVGFRVRSLVAVPFQVIGFGGFGLALVGSVVAVLLVACANLANLQLARGVARTRELATRAAVGASRRQIVAQLTAESGWLAAGGLVTAGILTWWGMHLVESFTPPTYGGWEIATQMSWRVLLFAVVVTLLCLTLVGLLPALRLSRVDLNELLKSGAGTGSSRTMRRHYGALIIVEVALALALLSSASLLTFMAMEIRSVAAEHDAEGVQRVVVGVVPEGPRDRRTRRDWSDRITQLALAGPGMTHAATVTWGATRSHAVSLDDPGGGPIVVPAPQWGYSVVSGNYLRTVQIPIVRGRDFAPDEFAEAQAIVDERTARCLWPGADPVGRLIKLDSAHVPGPWLRVVGVAENERSWELQYGERMLVEPGCAKPVRPGDVYVLNASDTTAIPPLNPASRRSSSENFELVFRGNGDPMHLGVQLRRSLMDVSSVTYVTYPRPWERIRGLASLRASQTFVAALFAIFAALAVALAAMGVYSIVSFSVAQRTREFGLRIALGAGARQIHELVARETNLLTLLGIVGGLLITWQSAGLLRRFLFSEWDRYDSRVFAVAVVVLFATAWLASWIPARRAMRINPVEALRND